MHQLHTALLNVKYLFLYYNIPREECEIFQSKVDDLLNHIYKSKETSERVYFEKEPENL